jgi:RNA polymerase sigma-70 factor (ECF subfamily)
MGQPLRNEHAHVESIDRIRGGDIVAFEALFRAYYEKLLRFSLGYIGSLEAAEDLVQDVFARIWEQRAGWEVRESMAAYLYGSVRNRCLDYVRHRLVERRWAERVVATNAYSGDELQLVPESADAALEQDELDRAIRVAVQRLPERCRQTFLLSREHGLTYQEIAVVMGVSVPTVKIQIGRALRSLRTSLAPFLTTLVLLLASR